MNRGAMLSAVAFVRSWERSDPGPYDEVASPLLILVGLVNS